MRTLSYIIPQEDGGKNVGELLKKRLRVSQRLLSELKNSGGILLNGQNVTVRKNANPGDILEIKTQDSESSENVVPVRLPIKILYEDEDILALSKPKDMPVHPSMGNYENTLGNAVMYYFSRKYPDEKFVYRPVTRLDRDTTGVVIVAKNRLCAMLLSEEMQNGIFEKTYLAYLSKTPEAKSGQIIAPIERESDSVIKRCVSDSGKYAETHYEIIKEFPDGTSVARVFPLTGRTHQIRVHFAYIGCPLLYDYMYGTEIPPHTLFLHCEKISFTHPVTGEKLLICDKEYDFFSEIEK